MRSAVRFSILAILAAGCVAGTPDSVPDCDGHDGLDVTVDLSTGECARLSQPIDFALNVTISGHITDKNAAHATWDPVAHRMRYVFDWPAGVGDGSPGTVEWYGSGDGAINGYVTAPIVVHRSQCLAVELAPTCSIGVDAQPSR
jgi:hypothetical protein